MLNNHKEANKQTHILVLIRRDKKMSIVPQATLTNNKHYPHKSFDDIQVIVVSFHTIEYKPNVRLFHHIDIETCFVNWCNVYFADETVCSRNTPRTRTLSSLWRHNGSNVVSNHRPHDCLLNRSFRCRSKKTSKLHVTCHCAGNSPVTSEFPA